MIVNCKDKIEEMLGDINYLKDSRPGKLYPFNVRVGIVQKRPPRHDYFQYMLEMGRTNIERIFDGISLGGLKELIFIFPERWMSIAEQQRFMSVIVKHPEVNTIERIDIITSAPLLISNFYSEQVRILTWEDDKNYDKE